MRVRRIKPEELSPWHRAFAEACGDAAIVHPVNAVSTVRWNAGFEYLDPVRGQKNLTILADTLVDRVVLDGDRAVGVATTAGELRARRVVLAAGAYGSPVILLRSGVGPERELPVGEGLIDHVAVGFAYESTDLLQHDVAAFERSHPLFMAQVTVALSSSACASGVSDLFFFPRLDPPGEHGYEVSVAVFAMKPASRGSVHLNSSDLAGHRGSTTASSRTPWTRPFSPRASNHCAGSLPTTPFGSTPRAGRDCCSATNGAVWGRDRRGRLAAGSDDEEQRRRETDPPTVGARGAWNSIATAALLSCRRSRSEATARRLAYEAPGRRPRRS